MYWFFTDETNREPQQGGFFIYGGLVLMPEQVVELHTAVSQIRNDFGYQDTDPLKFATKSRPGHMTQEAWTISKRTLLEVAVDIGVDMIVYVVHHRIAAGKSPDDRLGYALNAVLRHFNSKYLAGASDYGAVCVDRLDPTFFRYLESRFQRPLEFASSGYAPRLDRIVHYSMSSDGASHITSVVDIALGAFRYCANAAMGQGSDRVAAQMLPLVARLMWHSRKGPGGRIGGYGLIQYPKEVRSPLYRQDYRRLISGLERYSLG